MSVRTKLTARLAALEVELMAKLREALSDSAAGRDDLVFMATRYLPKGYPPQLISQRANELAALSDTVLELSAQLGISPEGSPAYLYHEACRLAVDGSKHHRPAPQGIARQLLARLGGLAPN